MVPNPSIRPRYRVTDNATKPQPNKEIRGEERNRCRLETTNPQVLSAVRRQRCRQRQTRMDVGRNLLCCNINWLEGRRGDQQACKLTCLQTETLSPIGGHTPHKCGHQTETCYEETTQTLRTLCKLCAPTGETNKTRTACQSHVWQGPWLDVLPSSRTAPVMRGVSSLAFTSNPPPNRIGETARRKSQPC